MGKMKLRINKDYLYIAPAVIFVGIFFITSVCFTVYISFFEWDGFSPMEFVGLSNYKKLFSDSNFKISFLNTIVWVVGSLLVTTVVPFLLAIAILNSYAPSIFKSVLYFPKAFSLTVGGMIISVMLSSSGIPKIAELFGRPDLVFDWLSIPRINTLIMILMTMWQGIGLNLLLFIGGLKTIDESPVEAAMIDGASPSKLYLHIIIPMLKPTIIIVFLMSIVNSFKVFDNIWIMTKGGPYRTSETLALTMYTESFIYNRLGSGAAVAVVLSFIVMFLSYFNIKDTFENKKGK